MKIFAYAMYVRPGTTEVVSTDVETDRFNSLVASGPHLARGAEGIMYIMNTEGFESKFIVEASVMCAKADASAAASFFIRQTDTGNGLHPFGDEFAKQADFAKLYGVVDENRHHIRLRNFAGYHSPFYLLLSAEPLNFVNISVIMDKAGYTASNTKFVYTSIHSQDKPVEEKIEQKSKEFVARLTFDNRPGAIYFNPAKPVVECVYNLPEDNHHLVRDLSDHPMLLSAVMPSLISPSLLLLDMCSVSDVPLGSIDSTVIVDQPSTSVDGDSTVDLDDCYETEEPEVFDREDTIKILIEAALISKKASRGMSDKELQDMLYKLEHGPDEDVSAEDEVPDVEKATVRARELVRDVHQHLTNEFADINDSDVKFFALRYEAKINILSAYNIDLYGLDVDDLKACNLDCMENLVLRVSQHRAHTSEPAVAPFVREEIVGSYLRGN